MISPAQRQMPVLEGKSNFLSGTFQRWLNTIQKRLNTAVVSDANGNIAYGNAVIPDDVDPDHFHIFYPYNAVRVINGSGFILDVINGYVKNDGAAQWAYLSDGIASLSTQVRSGAVLGWQRSTAPSGLAGDNLVWDVIETQDAIGNINIKTGSTYTATL